MKRECTLKEIAKIAGVSPTTVQNVLNGKKECMRETTYRKVLAVIQEKGYVEKAAPKLLNGKTERIIGIVVTDRQVESDEIMEFVEAMLLVEQENSKKRCYTIFHVSHQLDEIVIFYKAWPTRCLYVWGFEEEEIWQLEEGIGIPVHPLLG